MQLNQRIRENTRKRAMSKTGYFLLRTTFRDDYDVSDAARDVEQQAEAVCIDYMYFKEDEDYSVSPYIAY